MSGKRSRSPIDEASRGLGSSIDSIKQELQPGGSIIHAIGKSVIGLILLAGAIGFAQPVFELLFAGNHDAPSAQVAPDPAEQSNHRDGQNAPSTRGPAINESGAGDAIATDNHSVSSGDNSGNSSTDNRSIDASGSTLGAGAVINNGRDVNSHNNNTTFNLNGPIDAAGIKELNRSAARSGLTPKQFLDRYIDGSTGRLADRPTVALHVLNLPGFETTGLLDAASDTLTELGYHVPAMFREPFSGDGLDKELFRGSAKLATQLQLQQHCDGVLLGQVQLKPANNLQGLFITEASISLHQIAVDSGAVAQNLVIRAKGSGLNADASAASALRELEENIKQRLAEWTLT